MQTVRTKCETMKSFDARGKFLKGLDWVFENVGKAILLKPKLVIILCVLLSVVCFQGVHVMKLETSPELLFTPRNSKAMIDQVKLQSLFGEDPRLNEVYVITTDSSDNILSYTYLIAITRFISFIQTDIIANHNSEVVNYSSACFSSSDGCTKFDSLTSIWNHNTTVLSLKNDTEIQLDIQEALNAPYEDNVNTLMPYRSFLGKDAHTADNITFSNSLKITFSLTDSRRGALHDDPYSLAFEVALYHYLLHNDWRYSQGPGLEFYPFSMGTEEYINHQTVRENVSIVAVGYMIMVGYCCLYLGHTNWVQSHCILGIGSVVSVLLSTATAFGICWFAGVTFSPVVQVSVLLLLGIGIDDSFIIMQSWWAQPSTVPLSTRFVNCIRNSGPSILTTSVTDLCAFLAGSYTDIPAIRAFCIHAGLGVIFDFLYQITFFTAIAYYDFRREGDLRLDCLCCVKVPGDSDPVSCCYLPISKLGKPRGGKSRISNYTLSLPGKVMSILITACLVVVSVSGWHHVEMNFEKAWLTPDNDSFQKVYSVQHDQFDGLRPQAYLYQTLNLIYFEESLAPQVAFLHLINATYGSEWVEPGSHSTWFFPFIKWRKLDQGVALIPPYEFRWALGAFLESAEGQKWQTDVKISGDIAYSRTRFLLNPASMKSGEGSVSAMDEVRKFTTSIPECSMFDCYPHSRLFIFWEATKLVTEEVRNNVTAASIAVFTVTLLLLGSILASVIVLVMILTVDFFLFGFMPLVGCDFNTISVICIVLAIGLAVDSSLHVAHAFLSVRTTDSSCNCENSSRLKRARHAVDSVGMPVLCSGLSTFLAVLPLSLSESYIFQVFFKLLSLILGFGLWVGIIVLPLVLSYLGPEPFPNATVLDNENNENDPPAEPVQSQAEPTGIGSKIASLTSLKSKSRKYDVGVASDSDMNAFDDALEMSCHLPANDGSVYADRPAGNESPSLEDVKGENTIQSPDLEMDAVRT
eukprot:TRINITY_DN22687_c0_g1_i1.p1 TRINITY_DN22687_c0_g1~~TRINITY_DN22687_c0_g1_i1.p1  ORF type:complete len:976 (+),score=93.60 TRINITY_DN22687_c0_g1_i1:85-3012(+)